MSQAWDKTWLKACAYSVLPDRPLHCWHSTLHCFYAICGWKSVTFQRNSTQQFIDHLICSIALFNNYTLLWDGKRMLSVLCQIIYNGLLQWCSKILSLLTHYFFFFKSIFFVWNHCILFTLMKFIKENM